MAQNPLHIDNIFVIIAKEDMEMYEKHLKKHLPKNTCTQYDLPLGHKRIEEARQKIEEADVVLCITSASWYKDDDKIEEDMQCPKLYEYARASRQKIIVPIFWSAHDTVMGYFKEYISVPRDGVPFMKKENDYDEVATEIVKEIRTLCETKDKTPTIPTFPAELKALDDAAKLEELRKLVLTEVRAQYHRHGFYFEREHDQQLRQYLDQKKHCVVMGNPLAGKNCALFEALCRLPYPLPTLRNNY